MSGELVAGDPSSPAREWPFRCVPCDFRLDRHHVAPHISVCHVPPLPGLGQTSVARSRSREGAHDPPLAVDEQVHMRCRGPPSDAQTAVLALAAAQRRDPKQGKRVPRELGEVALDLRLVDRLTGDTGERDEAGSIDTVSRRTPSRPAQAAASSRLSREV